MGMFNGFTGLRGVNFKLIYFIKEPPPELTDEGSTHTTYLTFRI